jgi:hypothetical protein
VRTSRRKKIENSYQLSAVSFQPEEWMAIWFAISQDKNNVEKKIMQGEKL